MNRLETEVKAKGLTVFARIDHAAGAAQVGLPLPATELLIFGNAKVAHTAHAVGSDNRNRFAAKGAGQAGRIEDQVAFIQGSRLARKRHGASHDVEGTVTALTGALHAFAKAATGVQ
jgi:hypothetical protein